MAGTPLENRSSPLDWERVELWAQQFDRGEFRQINAVFEANSALAPRVLWQPRSSQIQTPQLRFLLDYWRKLKGDARLPSKAGLDLCALAPIAAYASLLDAVDDGRNFRFRRCGAAVAALRSYDMVGRLLSEYALGYPAVYIVESALALCRAAYRRAEPVYFERAPAGTAMAHGWHSLLLPLADHAGSVAGLLSGAVPVGAAGLPTGTMRF